MSEPTCTHPEGHQFADHDCMVCGYDPCRAALAASEARAERHAAALDWALVYLHQMVDDVEFDDPDMLEEVEHRIQYTIGYLEEATAEQAIGEEAGDA